MYVNFILLQIYALFLKQLNSFITEKDTDSYNYKVFILSLNEQ